MKLSQKLLVTGSLVIGSLGLSTYKIESTKPDLKKTLETTPTETLENTNNSVSKEVAEFFSQRKHTGIPEAMLDFLANTKHDIQWRLEVVDGENLPQFVRERINSYANQKHALLALRKKLSVNDLDPDKEKNPEGIVTFFNFTRGAGGPVPAQLIVYSHQGDVVALRDEVFELTDKNELSPYGNPSFPTSKAKDIINEEHIQ